MKNLIAGLALGLAVVGGMISGAFSTARAATVEEMTAQISALGAADRETFLAKGAFWRSRSYLRGFTYIGWEASDFLYRQS